MDEFLDNLKGDDILLDPGAGRAVAMREFIRDRAAAGKPPVQTVAVGFAKPEDQQLDADLVELAPWLRYVSGGKIEEMVKEKAVFTQ